MKLINELNGKFIESKVVFEKYLEKEKLDKEISMAKMSYFEQC